MQNLQIANSPKRSSWHQAPFPHELKMAPTVSRLLDQVEPIEISLVSLVDKIPFHTWWGSIASSKIKLLERLRSTNISTISAICTNLIQQWDNYWNDNRDRDFSGIMETIQKRLTELWCKISEFETRHYMSDDNKRRLSIPSKIEKIS